jgi:hypothetical protein
MSSSPVPGLILAGRFSEAGRTLIKRTDSNQTNKICPSPHTHRLFRLVDLKRYLAHRTGAIVIVPSRTAIAHTRCVACLSVSSSRECGETCNLTTSLHTAPTHPQVCTIIRTANWVKGMCVCVRRGASSIMGSLLHSRRPHHSTHHFSLGGHRSNSGVVLSDRT